ncbi:MAG: transposase [Bdellovibrionia bacterium]
MARIYRCNYKTVVRKFLFLSSWAEVYFKRHRDLFPPSKEVEFDDLETFEHSKLKPLSVAMMIETKTRRILGFNVAQMSAKGLLAPLAKKKYGTRKDLRNEEREKLFKELKPYIAEEAKIKSDESPHYPMHIKKYFPKSTHWTTKGRRGCVVGQGELKSGGFDPLFTLNHTFAMFRANINRLFRRTWNTTKKPDRLKKHIWLYVLYHNLAIIE